MSTKAPSSRRRKQRVTTHKSFPIRHLPNGKFLVDIRRGTLRERQRFDTLGEAKGHCDQLDFDLKQGGEQNFVMGGRERNDALRAMEILGPEVSLSEAARFWKRHHAGQDARIPFEQVIAEHLRDSHKRRLRSTTLKELEVVGKRFHRDLGQVKLNALTRERLEDWLERKGGPSAANYNKHLRYLKLMLNFAMRRGYLSINPAESLRSLKREKRLPEILPNGKVEALLRAAEGKYPRLVPYLAIGFFAGLRPSEIQGLRWADIDLEQNLIHVLPEVSKSRRSRFVDISENLHLWLKAYWRANEPDPTPPYMTFRRWRSEIAQDCGFNIWPHDVMRHCFATHYLAIHTIDETCKQLGHTNDHMLYDHYRGLARAGEAKRFWEIAPN